MRLTLATKAASAAGRRIPAVGRGLQLWLPICSMAPLVALIAAAVPSLVPACIAPNSSQLTLKSGTALSTIASFQAHYTQHVT